MSMAMYQPTVDTLYTTLYPATNGILKDNFVPAGKRFFVNNAVRVWTPEQWAAGVAAAGSDAAYCQQLTVATDERDGY